MAMPTLGSAGNYEVHEKFDQDAYGRWQAFAKNQGKGPEPEPAPEERSSTYRRFSGGVCIVVDTDTVAAIAPPPGPGMAMYACLPWLCEEYCCV